MNSKVGELTPRIPEANSDLDSLRNFESHYGLSYSTFDLLNTAKTFGDNPLVRTTYPENRVADSLLNNRIRDDPIVSHGGRNDRPLDGSETEVTPKALTVAMGRKSSARVSSNARGGPRKAGPIPNSRSSSICRSIRCDPISRLHG